jgi:hypothetical protein
MAGFVLYRALDRLAASLQRAGSPIRAALQPGRPDDDVRQALRGLDLVAPYQVVDLYAWADGTGVGGGAWDGPELFPATRFPSLAQAAADYRAARSWHGPGPALPREWFPVFVATAGGQVCVQCGLGAGRGTVWWVPPGPGPDAVPLFDSLADAADAARWSIETGRWHVDPDGSLRA